MQLKSNDLSERDEKDLMDRIEDVSESFKDILDDVNAKPEVRICLKQEVQEIFEKIVTEKIGVFIRKLNRLPEQVTAENCLDRLLILDQLEEDCNELEQFCFFKSFYKLRNDCFLLHQKVVGNIENTVREAKRIDENPQYVGFVDKAIKAVDIISQVPGMKVAVPMIGSVVTGAKVVKKGFDFLMEDVSRHDKTNDKEAKRNSERQRQRKLRRTAKERKTNKSKL